MSDDDKNSVDSDARKTGQDGDKNPEAKSYTQDQLDFIIAKRFRGAKEEMQAEIDDLKAKLESASKNTDKPGDKDDKGSKDDSLSADSVKELIKSALNETVQNFDKKMAKRDLLAEHGKGLLPAYRAGIDGSNEAEILESIADAKEKQAKEMKEAGLGVKEDFGGGNENPKHLKNGKTFKKSELQDRKFVAKNHKAIMAAAKEGRIIDDL